MQIAQRDEVTLVLQAVRVERRTSTPLVCQFLRRQREAVRVRRPTSPPLRATARRDGVKKCVLVCLQHCLNASRAAWLFVN